MNFHELGLRKALLRTLEEIGHTEPTPIQAQAIPAVLDGRDVIGLAQTGTGKTAAFLLPLLHKTDDPGFRAKYRPIKILVLSPTRELASQIFEKARQYGKSLNLKSQCTVGGIPIARQQKALSRGTDILIATPGRLLDLVKRNAIQLDKVNALVLDEADHMLDIGFFPDVKRIMAKLPISRQTLLFSATMPKAIQDLASDYLDNPVEVSVARNSSVVEKIDQSVIHIPARAKPDRLVTLLQKYPDERVMVFARTKHGSDKIVKRLQTLEIEARAIHGNKTQSQRERALKAFTNGDCKVLIATDIAARGIDIKNVGVVINYELPEVPEVYVHRIGRTARAGSVGMTIAFCSPDEFKKLKAIEKLIKQTIPAEGEIVEPLAEQKTQKPKRRPQRKNRPGANARRRDRSSEKSDSGSDAKNSNREKNSENKSGQRSSQAQNTGKPNEQKRQKSNKRPRRKTSRPAKARAS